jgi:hypothetical protein
MMPQPFSFAEGSTVSINVGAASASVQVVPARGTRQIRVMNNGSATAWIRFANATGSTASMTTDVPMGPGTSAIFTAKIRGPIWASAIAAGATGLIYFTPGDGHA